MKDRTENVLNIFTELSRVPRQSGNSGAVTDWVTAWATEQGFSFKRDAKNNVVIAVPATAGREGEPVVVLQGHSDMVCEKNPESNHNFSQDPIELIREGEWLSADQTTLGADNGIALALAFDLALNREVSHPPLEILITSDEEIGLVGANGLEPGFIEGKTLINIDSEDEGVLTVGCAGGMDCLFDIKADFEASRGSLFSLVIGGLAGGHSGVDIHLGRGSAVKLAGRMLASLPRNVSLVSLDAGSKATNAIPRRAEMALLAGERVDSLTLENWAEGWGRTFSAELGGVDPGLTVTLQAKGDGEERVLSGEGLRRLADLICAMPQGPMAWSREMEGLVETSTNLAYVHTEEDRFRFGTSQRSSLMSRLVEINRRVESLARLAGADPIVTRNKYPAWQPVWESPLLSRAKAAYRKLFGKEAVVEVIHAGLETGVIGARYEGMDMVSLGPTIGFPHSPDEKLHVPSLAKVYELLTEILA